MGRCRTARSFSHPDPLHGTPRALGEPGTPGDGSVPSYRVISESPYGSPEEDRLFYFFKKHVFLFFIKINFKLILTPVLSHRPWANRLPLHGVFFEVYYESIKREPKIRGIKKCRCDERLEVYYESIKREPKIRGIKKCRCDERLQTKTKEFTRLPYTEKCMGGA